ncbi:MAG TPA: hypothetical protein VJ343_01990, partial [archaeon]|nr:hypothetical protein [archaeon]
MIQLQLATKRHNLALQDSAALMEYAIDALAAMSVRILLIFRQIMNVAQGYYKTHLLQVQYALPAITS